MDYPEGGASVARGAAGKPDLPQAPALRGGKKECVQLRREAGGLLLDVARKPIRSGESRDMGCRRQTLLAWEAFPLWGFRGRCLGEDSTEPWGLPVR